jgi:glycosyltransferase involved in cell wall biosynthesis
LNLVSVIIPTYNCARYVNTAIQSVLEQSYSNTEIIVVDDGSTDETRDVIQSFKKEIVYIHQENKGLPGARNRGIQEASGEYVAFLDADDLWRKDKLEIQAQVLESFPSVYLVFSDFSVFDENGYKEQSYFYKGFPFFHEYKFTLNDIFPNKFQICSDRYPDEVQIFHGHIARYLFCGNFILPSSVLIRKSAIDHLGGFDESYKIAEETEFFLRLCTSYDVAYVDRPLVDYLVKRAGNLTGSSNTERLIKNAISIQENYLSKHPGLYESNKSFFDMAIAKSYTRLAYYYLTMTRNKAARIQARKSISLKPFQAIAYSYWLLSFCPPALLGAAGRFKQFLKVFSRG